MVRKYSWSIAWLRAPDAGEVSGLLSVATATGSPQSIRIGQIYARIGGESPFLPAVVYLERGTKEREIVIARASATIWTIGASLKLPEWLAVSPTETLGRQAFELRLADSAPRQGASAAVVPFESTDGARWQLRVSPQFESAYAPGR